MASSRLAARWGRCATKGTARVRIARFGDDGRLSFAFTMSADTHRGQGGSDDAQAVYTGLGGRQNDVHRLDRDRRLGLRGPAVTHPEFLEATARKNPG